jgi:hydrogenase nickel incorporation protein HypA/HybF
MHEISLVRSIFKTLESEFSGEDLAKLRGIHLRIGGLANVEPMLLQSAFQAVVESDYPAQNPQLHIEALPVLVHCQPCNLTSEVTQYRFVCACGKPNGNVVQGNELLIGKVEFAE